ncbi:hypothetical protein [Paenibacillus zanthoxyli]|uniref:hypothetical protein n=1 Tax=Paenibacillus zanthoxyli TaxID=369399 RepID=UPI00047123D3|nr:hypothetical protein [Paenibacillus zanthoxyli]
MDVLNQLKNVGQGTMLNYNGDTYFSLERLTFLTNILSKNELITELVITPYYFFDDRIMELYDYALSIKIVESIGSREAFLLEETGKKSIEEIDLEVVEKLDNTYFEVELGDLETFLNSLRKYLGYMNEQEPHLLTQTRKELSTHGMNNDGIFYRLN